MACGRDFTPPRLPTLNPPPWYLLVSEIKLLLPLGHPLVGDPLLSPSLCFAEIRRGGRMVPAAAGGQAVVSRGTPPAPRDTMPCQPCHGSQIRWGPGHPPVLQCHHRETPGCQLRADRGVQGPAREPGLGGNRVRAPLPTQGRSERGHGRPRTPVSPSWLWPRALLGSHPTERLPGRGRR